MATSVPLFGGIAVDDQCDAFPMPTDTLSGWWWVFRSDGEDLGDCRFGLAGNADEPSWAEGEYIEDDEEQVTLIAQRFTVVNDALGGSAAYQERRRTWVPWHECPRCEGEGDHPAGHDGESDPVSCLLCGEEGGIEGHWVQRVVLG